MTTVDRSAWELVDAVQRLSLARTPEDIQAIVRRAGRNLCSADGATLVLRESEWCRYVDEDAIEPLWKGRRFPLDACVSGWVMKHGEAVGIADIYDDERVPQDAYRPTFVSSLAMVPIRRDRPIGAIGNYWADRHEPTPEELALLQALADSTAVAIENVTVWSDLESRVTDRTAELQHSLTLNERLLNTLAHEIRNAVTAAAGLLEIALRAPDDALDASTRELVEYARRATADGGRIVEDQLLAARDRAGELSPRFDEIAIAEFLGDLAGPYAALRSEADVRVVVEPGDHPPVMRTDPHLLQQALRNLMSNSLKFTTTGYVTVRADRADGGRVVFTITDSGAGIPPEQHERIFDEWAQVVADAYPRGSGLGLPFVRRISEVLGGEARLVRSIPGEGSVFTLTVPDADADPATAYPGSSLLGIATAAQPE